MNVIHIVEFDDLHRGHARGHMIDKVSNICGNYMILENVYIICEKCKRKIRIVADLDIPKKFTLTMHVPSECGKCGNKALKYTFKNISFLLNPKKTTSKFLGKSKLRFISVGKYEISDSQDENDIRKMKIEDLQLCRRAENLLKRGGINFVGQLVSYGPKALMEKIHMLGKKTVEEIRECLSFVNVEWR